MKIHRLLLAAGLASLMTGCATNMVWYQDGKSLADAESDWRVCKFEATKHGYVQASPFGDPIASGASAGIEQAFRQNDIMKACMESKGYRLIHKSQVEQMGGTVQRFR